jgi:hypothetical protein
MADDFGLARFRWNGGRAPWVVRSAIADGIERGAIYVRRAMKRLINTPYPPASVPGEPPHRRTGNLYRNIDVFINRQTLTAQVGPTDKAEYGLYLEYGAPRANLEPRPFMFVALKQEATRVTNTINRAAAIAFNKYGRSQGQ